LPWAQCRALLLSHFGETFAVDEFEAERLRKAHELVGLIHEIQRGPEMPPPLEYRPEEPEEDEPKPSVRRGGIG
jgi:hypothetical protein